MLRPLFLAGLLSLPVSVAQAQELEGFITRDRLPDPNLPALVMGGEVWADTCENCHGGNKLTGAPKITSDKAWARRIEKGMDVLVAHAIDGFIGPTYKEMPARGGNSDLSDDAVKAAVAFMVWASGGADSAIPYAEQNIATE
ncbi:cytochrome c5 [Actibacterium atlanticum]|uniref:Cytochrome c5 n=1 Tax=Actibacterium atlanticum TaxID=1461693 RepID=A0A058ZM13_9RHOB|nr:c-type cytochrome [Actibacterium atlanticum]KCV82664.1 cytochrome c5 [Actibacterium atlanticum]